MRCISSIPGVGLACSLPVPKLLCGLALGGLLLGAFSPHAHAASILPNGRLLVDGKKFYPIGLVSNGYKVYPNDWHHMIRESRANVVWDIEIAYADTAIGCEALVDSAAAAGYKLIVGSGDTWHWDWPDTEEAEVDQAMYEPGEFNNLLECGQHVPGTIIGYANRDEPVWTTSRSFVGDIDSTHIMWTYEQLKAGDPDGVVAMNFAPAHLSEDIQEWKNDIGGYLGATDVVMFASYPYPAGEDPETGQPTCGPKNVVGYPECKMDRLPIAADIFLNELNRPGQPLWMVIQGFKNIPYKEAKWEATAAIVHGATGIFWAGWTWWHTLGNGVDTWPVTSRVIEEFAGMHKVLAGWDLPGARTDNSDVEARAMKGNGHHAATFAISRNGYTGPVRIKLPGASHGMTVTVRNEQRTLVVDNGWISDHFDGYEAHVYKYQLHHGGGPTSAPDVAPGARSFEVRVFPNPARGQATVEFELPRNGSVVFTVYDAAGRRVALAGSGHYEAGRGTIEWNGRDYYGKPVAPGVYFIQARTSHDETATARVLLQR